MKKQLLLIPVLLVLAFGSFAEDTKPAATPTYTKVVGYVSFLHPIATVDENSTTFNFTNHYTVGFPIGINVLKSDKFGFTFEVAPFLRVQNDISKITHFTFHPGAMFRFKGGTTIVTRLAFETTGRYGVTPVLSQVLFRSDNVNYFAAFGMPLRVGNDKPFTLGTALQFGVTF